MTTGIHHGTYGGYQVHRRRGEEACPSCLDAQAAYMRQLREANPDLRVRERNRQHAYDRATQRLRDAHRAEMQRYYREELGR